MATKKSRKKKSVGKGARPGVLAAKKTGARKPGRSSAKASHGKASAKATRSKATRSKATRPKSVKGTRAQTARAKSAKGARAKATTQRRKEVASRKAKQVAPASARPRASVNGVHRRDRAGHLDPKYAADLRAKSREGQSPSGDSNAFVRGSQSADDLAESLGEETVEAMTTGEDEGTESRDRFEDEEIGGPFVESSGNKEFADDSDESNPDDATREPFPKT